MIILQNSLFEKYYMSNIKQRTYVNKTIRHTISYVPTN